MTNNAKVRKYLLCQSIKTTNFTSKVKFKLGIEDTHPDGYEARIALYGPNN